MARNRDFHDEGSGHFVGQRFGLWEVTGPVCRGKCNLLSLPVRCECGFESVVTKSDLLQGKTKCCVGCTDRRDSSRYKTHPLGGLMPKLRSTAKDRGIPFEVSRDYLADLADKQEWCCAMTGVPIRRGKRLGAHKFDGKTMSLDRIDSGKGYVEGNVQWVHKDINVAKNSLSNEAFLSMCLNVVVHQLGIDPNRLHEITVQVDKEHSQTEN